MTRHEDEAQQVVPDMIVECGVQVRNGALELRVQLVPYHGLLAMEHRIAAQAINGAGPTRCWSVTTTYSSTPWLA